MLFEPEPKALTHEAPEYVGLKQLAMEISPIVDLPLATCKRMIRLLCELTIVHLEGGRSVHLPGLGKFTSNNYRTFYSRDFKTGVIRVDEDGNPIRVRRISLVYFKPCLNLKRRVHTEHPLSEEELDQINNDNDNDDYDENEYDDER